MSWGAVRSSVLGVRATDQHRGKLWDRCFKISEHK